MTLRIRLLSDLHLEAEPLDRIPDVQSDVVVLAGDLHPGTHGLDWARRQFPDTQIIAVLGNHEAYGEVLPQVLEASRAKARALGIHLLERDTVQIADVLFHGATLWTDYAVDGDARRAMTQQAARQALSDHRWILVPDAAAANGLRAVTPDDLQAIHEETVAWLEYALAVCAGTARAQVVVTHHVPSTRATHQRFRGSPINGAFASNLDHLVERASLWLCGHTHDAHDVRIGAGRLVVNPRGYPSETYRNGFDPGLVLTV